MILKIESASETKEMSTEEKELAIKTSIKTFEKMRWYPRFNVNISMIHKEKTD